MAVTAGVAIAGLLYSGYKAFHAASQEKRAREEADRLRRPFEKVQDEYYQNQNMAREIATTGLPADTKNYLETKRNQGLGTSLEALKEAGGNPNDFARINSIYDESLKNESAEDAQQHLANMQYLAGVNKDIAGQKTTQWGVNELQPYETKLKEIQDRRLAAQQNINNAVDEGIGYASAAGTSIQNAKNPNPNPGTGGTDISVPAGTPQVIGRGGNPNDIPLADTGQTIQPLDLQLNT